MQEWPLPDWLPLLLLVLLLPRWLPDWLPLLLPDWLPLLLPSWLPAGCSWAYLQGICTQRDSPSSPARRGMISSFRKKNDRMILVGRTKIHENKGKGNH